MTNTYVTDITHYLNESGDLAEMPAAARKLASFLGLLIDAASQVMPMADHDTRIRCRKRGCQGSVRASLPTRDSEITWHCPVCGLNGMIHKWQGSKWDQSGQTVEGNADRSQEKPKPAPKYTLKEGQYLAFIYCYTKLNRQAPAELDMQKYFRVTPPAVHDMIVKLEKHGFISREPGVSRSIRLLLKREELPDLE